MAMKNRILISFAIEDERSRDFLVGQARLDHSSFEFVDMSVKEPWSDSWKTRCRSKIKGCGEGGDRPAQHRHHTPLQGRKGRRPCRTEGQEDHRVDVARHRRVHQLGVTGGGHTRASLTRTGGL